MLFNTLSGDVINHSKNYFDKMELSRYREALPRIFDLALGITTIENLMIQDKIAIINRDIQKLEKDKNLLEKEIENRTTSLKIIIRKAKEAKIMSPNRIELDECVRELKNIVQRAYYMSDKNLIYPAVSTVIVEESKEVVKTKTLTFKDIERESIIRALALNKGNVIEAAEDLHISKATIYRKIKKYSIDLKEIKEST